MMNESNTERTPSTSNNSLVKIDLEVLAEPKIEPIERDAVATSNKCMKCSASATSICGFCIGCWRFCLNSCEVCMECNIRCCTCAKACLERIDCDETK